MDSLPLLFAHAFGQTYTLPIPLWLFLFAAGAIIIVSFVVIALLVSSKPRQESAVHRTADIRALLPVCRTIGMALFLLTLAAGPLTVSAYTFTVIFFWIIVLIGLMYAVALFGNIWELFNPFRTLFAGFERLLGPQQKPLFTYPARLSYYPALMVYFGLIWLELLSNSLGIMPDSLAYILLAYTAFTLLGAFLFGKNTWFKYGEFFSVFYATVARVSSVVITDTKLSLQRPFAGISSGKAIRFSLLLFVLFMLVSTGFDAFRETKTFAEITDRLPTALTNATGLYQSLFLLCSVAFLLALYGLAMAWMRRQVTAKLSTFELMKCFGLTLLPIAIVYHMAHYFPLLIIHVPTFMQYLADPFQLGWNAFGSAQWQVRVGPLDAAFVWYSQVGLIIGGHIAAVYAAHRAAAQLFRAKEVIRSQYPMVILMVLYTVGSLWILGQPLA